MVDRLEGEVRRLEAERGDAEVRRAAEREALESERGGAEEKASTSCFDCFGGWLGSAFGCGGVLVRDLWGLRGVASDCVIFALYELSVLMVNFWC